MSVEKIQKNKNIFQHRHQVTVLGVIIWSMIAKYFKGNIAGANSITQESGGKPQFENMSEFESLMDSSDKLIL